MSFICADCVREPYLQRLVRDAATSDNPCEYCESDASAADLWQVARLCEEVIDTFFEESSHTMAVIHFNRIPAGNDLHTTIAAITCMPQEAVDVVVEYLQHFWHDDDSGESRFGDDDLWFVRKTSMAVALRQYRSPERWHHRTRVGPVRSCARQRPGLPPAILDIALANVALQRVNRRFGTLCPDRACSMVYEGQPQERPAAPPCLDRGRSLQRSY